MIDFTTIQANPIPQNIADLQATNLSLKKSNKFLGILLTIAIIGSITAFSYQRAYRNNNFVLKPKQLSPEIK